ncbi:tetratricopeptide repeat protein [Nonomuraea ceibae]|uniref:tetratricopeptide repeat protein n=1 Tax=Nonomuraea ceibae TaxID=1935170 RepID=UPI0035582CD9
MHQSDGLHQFVNGARFEHVADGAHYAVEDLRRAIPLLEAMLADRERVLGADHPNTLTFRNNLAYAYQPAGDLGRSSCCSRPRWPTAAGCRVPTIPQRRTVGANRAADWDGGESFSG